MSTEYLGFWESKDSSIELTLRGKSVVQSIRRELNQFQNGEGIQAWVVKNSIYLNNFGLEDEHHYTHLCFYLNNMDGSTFDMFNTGHDDKVNYKVAFNEEEREAFNRCYSCFKSTWRFSSDLRPLRWEGGETLTIQDNPMDICHLALGSAILGGILKFKGIKNVSDLEALVSAPPTRPDIGDEVVCLNGILMAEYPPSTTLRHECRWYNVRIQINLTRLRRGNTAGGVSISIDDDRPFECEASRSEPEQPQGDGSANDIPDDIVGMYYDGLELEFGM